MISFCRPAIDLFSRVHSEQKKTLKLIAVIDQLLERKIFVQLGFLVESMKEIVIWFMLGMRDCDQEDNEMNSGIRSRWMKTL